MNASDDAVDFPTRSIPELIKHLWDLYVVMSLDPALESSSEHIKQAALTLEHVRKLAFEVCQEGPPQKPHTVKAALPDEDMDAEAAKWLRVAKAGSQMKH